MISSTSRRFVVVAAVAAAVLAPSGSPARAGEDGPRIAFVRFSPEAGRLRILTRDLHSGPARALPVPVSDVQGPAWSPDGRRIAFVGGTGVNEARAIEQDVDLYVSRQDGRQAKRITRDRFREAAPAWAPDGSRIVFVRYGGSGNQSSLWTIRADGSAARRLTFGNVDLQPSWSPDGRRVVFVRISAGEAGIWEVRADGTGLRRIVPRLAGATRPVWSADGSRLLLTDGRTLFTVRPDGSDRRLVTRLTADVRGARVDPQPAWSRTGWIVFCQLRRGTHQRSDVWRVRSDGSGLGQVTRSPAFDSEPTILR